MVAAVRQTHRAEPQPSDLGCQVSSLLVGHCTEPHSMLSFCSDNMEVNDCLHLQNTELLQPYDTPGHEPGHYNWQSI